jgi:hypothetical protein
VACRGGHGGEAGGIGDGQLGQHLAVQAHVGPLEAADQLAVAEAVHAGGGVDPGDPEAAEVTLAAATVAVGIAEGLHDPLVGGAEQAAVAPLEAAGEAKDLVAAFAGDVAPLDAGHGR